MLLTVSFIPSSLDSEAIHKQTEKKKKEGAETVLRAPYLEVARAEADNQQLFGPAQRLMSRQREEHRNFATAARAREGW